jgi:hypothetical protein
MRGNVTQYMPLDDKIAKFSTAGAAVAQLR